MTDILRRMIQINSGNARAKIVTVKPPNNEKLPIAFSARLENVSITDFFLDASADLSLLAALTRISTRSLK